MVKYGEAYPKGMNSSPKLVWLMSFPNSGTSFTTRLIRRTTNQYTATNYGEENIDEEGFSVPILKEDKKYQLGPFLSEPSKSRSLRPTVGKLILTKTHCGGRCNRCGPKDYTENINSFKTDCLTARKGVSDANGKLSYEINKYDEDLVGKTIHLIRDPFDNIVSRFHLTQKKMRKTGDKEFQEKYPNNMKGFRKWCKAIDKKYAADEILAFEPEVINLFKEVPCHADFYRYVMWHNLAFGVVNSLGIPSMVLHYEDYGTDFNGTKSKLISFLETEEQTPRNNTSPKEKDGAVFIVGKSYRQYFSQNERSVTKNLIYGLSNVDTQREIQRYFID